MPTLFGAVLAAQTSSGAENRTIHLRTRIAKIPESISSNEFTNSENSISN